MNTTVGKKPQRSAYDFRSNSLDSLVLLKGPKKTRDLYFSPCISYLSLMKEEVDEDCISNSFRLVNHVFLYNLFVFVSF